MDDAPDIDVVSVADLARPFELTLGEDGQPVASLVFVDLDRRAHAWEVDAALQSLAAAPTTLVVGVSRQVIAPGLDRLADALTCVIGDGASSAATALVPDLVDAMRAITDTVTAAPRAAVTLDGLLQVTEQSGVRAGLVAESLAYSMLQAGPEFTRWRANRPVRASEPSDEPAVDVDRDGDHLRIELNRPARHNAFSREIRDGLVEALDLAMTDRSITQLVISGRGPSFCSGGDLDEFGTAPDPPLAHLVRLDRSVGARLDRLRARTTVEVHGACIGAGAELPAFTGRVVAAPDSFFQLPELPMGLVPGAGGTVSLTRRIGRSRTAFLALTGRRIDAATALDWGLVDRLV